MTRPAASEGGGRSEPSISVQRIYDAGAGPEGGYRVLVDRLWPRGISKADAGLDEWLKDAAPSTELRRWYGHEVARFEEFTRRYRRELRSSPGVTAVEHLRSTAGTRPLVLVTATRDVEHSGAEVLRVHLSGPTGPSPS